MQKIEKCKAITRKGKRCKKTPISGAEFCYLHRKNKTPIINLAWNFLRNNPLSIIGIILALTSIGLTIYNRSVDKEEEEFQRRLKALTGKIVPKNDTFNSASLISVGGAFIAVENGVLFTDNEMPIVTIKNENGRLLLSAVIRDDDGNEIAEILNNEWKINPNFSFDRNYTDNLIEVKNNRGEIILQAANDGDLIHFSGIITCSNGFKWVCGYDFELKAAIWEPRKKGQILSHKIKPFCFYPSQTNLGNCNSYTNMENIDKNRRKVYRITKGLNLCVSTKPLAD